MSNALRTYARFVVRHRLVVLAAVVAGTLLLALAATRLHVEIDADRQLPQDHPYIQTLNDVHRLFGDKNMVVVGLFPNDGHVFTPAFLAKVAEVTDRIRRLPGANPALVQSLAAPQVKDIRGAADGIAVEPVMATPPTDQAGADAVRARAFANDAYVGTLVAADGSAAAVQAIFELTPETPGYRQLHARVLETLRAADDGTFTYHLAGPVVLLAQLSEYAGRMIYYFPLALLVIGLVHYEAFRTLQALFLPLLTALLSVVWAIGLMGFLGVPLDPFNTTTPILILAVAAGHAVQILKRFYEEYDRCRDVQTAVVESLAHVGPVMLAAGTIAALSFCSLATFRTATIRTFGLFTGLGIVSALIIELTIIPAVRALLPPPRRREREREAASHTWLDRFLAASAGLATGTRRRWLFLAATVVVASSVVLATRVEVDTSHKREFGEREPVRVDDAAMNSHFAGTNTLIVLVEGAGEGALEEPAIMRAIDRLERRLEGEESVGKAVSYVDFLSKIHVAMNADLVEKGELPDTRALTAQYLFLYSLSGGAEDFDTLIDPSHRAAKIRILVHDDSTRYGQRLIAVAEDFARRTFPPGYSVRFTGTIANTAAVTEVMVHGKLANIAQISAITIIVASLLLRSLVGGLLVVLPLAVTIAVNFGIMGLFGIPLDTLTSAISAMAVGIGADYAIYLLFRVREELARDEELAPALRRALVTSGKAVFFVSSAIACGYATLCLSGFKFHVQLGALVAVAMLVSSLSALLLLPAIIAAFRPQFLWTRVQPAALAAATGARAKWTPAPAREAALRPMLPYACYETSIACGTAFVLAGVLLFLGGGVLAAHVVGMDLPLAMRLLAVVPLVLVASHGAHLLGWVGHEGIHLLLARNKHVSAYLGTFLSAMTSFSAVGYGVAHWNHHRFTNQESDPDARLYYPFRTFWSRFLWARPAGSRSHLRNTIDMARGRPLTLGYKLPFTAEQSRRLAVFNLVALAFWFGLYAMAAAVHPLGVVVGIVLPILILIPISGLRGYIEHAGTGVGMFRDTRSWAAPVFTVLFFGNNLHLEHHLYPGVPCYRLLRVHRFLRDGGWLARWNAPVETTVLGALRDTTSRSQYPNPVAPDRAFDPFVDAAAERLADVPAHHDGELARGTPAA
jgi:predicted RND superfamily exporter protein/fatty-acid desaturase